MVICCTVHGYDYTNDIFYIAGFINGRGFETFSVQLDELHAAITSVENTTAKQAILMRLDQHNGMTNGILYYSALYPYQISKRYVVGELRNYLNEMRFPSHESWFMGIQVYELFKKYCQFLNETPNADLFKQAIQVIYSHKIVLQSAVLKLCENETEYKETLAQTNVLKKELLIIRNTLLKYSVLNRLRDAVNLIPRIDAARNIEEELILPFTLREFPFV